MIDAGKGFYQFPASAGVTVGDTFTIDGRGYRVESVTSLRDEATIAKVTEVEDEQPKPRRASNRARGKAVQDEVESGLDSPDRDSD